ncbi:DUF257 family protein [Thermococcus sp.]
MITREEILSFRPGEIIVVEYTSKSQAPLVFSEILKAFGSENMLVLDIVDIGFTFKKALEIAGIEPDEIHSVHVIKIGGKINWGDVLAQFDVYSDPRVFIEKTENLIKERAPKKRGIVTFGTERVPIIHKDARRVGLYLVNCAAERLGNPFTTIFYFINRDIAERPFLGLMEDLATRVVMISEEGVRVIKSIQE